MRFIAPFLYANVVVSLSAAFLTYGVCYMAGIDNDFQYAAFSFLGTISVYNTQRLLKSEFMQLTSWLEWVNNKRVYIIPAVIFCSALASILLFSLQLNWNQILGLLFFGSISFLYVSPWKNLALRNVPGLKIHLIALSWIGILIAFPLMSKFDLTTIAIFSFIHYFYVIAVTIPFDIRDLKYDSKDKKTIPQVFGVKGSKIIALICLSIYIIGITNIYPVFFRSLLFYASMIITFQLIANMNEERGDFYCAGLVDGSIALTGISYMYI